MSGGGSGVTTILGLGDFILSGGNWSPRGLRRGDLIFGASFRSSPWRALSLS